MCSFLFIVQHIVRHNTYKYWSLCMTERSKYINTVHCCTHTNYINTSIYNHFNIYWSCKLYSVHWKIICFISCKNNISLYHGYVICFLLMWDKVEKVIGIYSCKTGVSLCTCGFFLAYKIRYADSNVFSLTIISSPPDKWVQHIALQWSPENAKQIRNCNKTKSKYGQPHSDMLYQSKQDKHGSSVNHNLITKS